MLGVAAASVGVAAVPDDCLLKMDFESGFVVARAPEGTTVKVDGQPACVPGVVGQAGRAGGKDRVTIRLPQGLDMSAGTVSLWVCPVDWTPQTERFQFCLTLPHATTPNQDMLLYKTHGKAALSLVVRNPEAGARSLDRPILSWRTGVWHHVAYSWDREGYRLYVDGEAAGKQPRLALSEDGWDRIVIGIPYPGWAYLGSERTDVDELSLFSRCLSAAEIALLFQHTVSGSPTLAAAKANQEKDMAHKRAANLSLSGNGGHVFASSFGNTGTQYTDLLIDGDLDSAWRSWDATVPQWVELRWEYPVTAHRLVFFDVPPSQITACTVQVWDHKGAWREAARLPRVEPKGDGRTEVAFGETTTDRLRLTILGNDGPFTQVSELEVYGPPQPRVGALVPYWKGWHVWYPEPDEKVHMEPRFFRREFDVPEASAVQSAFVQLYTNDLYEVSVNGRPAADGFKAMAPVAVGEHVRPGRNCLAVKATPTSQPGWRNMAMTVELTVNTDEGTQYVVCDDSWRTEREAGEGWQLAGFDDTGWSRPMMIGRVGQAIWGRLSYVDRTADERVVLRGAEIAEAELRPGDTATVRLLLEPTEPLRHEHVLVYTLGERPVVAGHGDYALCKGAVVPRPPTSSWPAGRAQQVELRIPLPVCAPDGVLPLRLRGLNTARGPGLRLVGAGGGAVDEAVGLRVSRLPQGEAGREGGEPVPVPPSIPRSRGLPVAGRDSVPLVWAFHNPTFEKLHLAAATGIHLYQARAYPLRADGTEETLDRFVSYLHQHIEAITRIDSDARVLVFLDLRPSMVWLKENPEARLLTAFGKHGPQSYFSQQHEELVLTHLRQLVPRLQALPSADRIFGYHLISCGTPDSALGGTAENVFETDRSKITLGDFNPQAIAAFRDWLRVRYAGALGDLRAAWRDESVTFESAAPRIGELTAEGVQNGIFRDPAEGAMPFDYFEFLSGGVYRFHAKAAACLRGIVRGGTILGCYYGYDVQVLTGYNGVGSVLQNNNFDETGMLGGDFFDYHAMVPSYAHRRGGTHFEPQHSLGSLLLHGKQYMAELDNRTFTAVTAQWGRHRSQGETIEILKRDLSEAILNGTAAWFADWSTGGVRGVGYYSDPDLLKTVKRAHEVYRDTLREPRESAAEIAVFVSGRTWYYHDIYRAPPLYHNLIRRMLYSEMPHIGAPYDVFRLEDLPRVTDLPGYKLFVFLNPFAMTEGERDAVRRLQQSSRTLVWFYAPGYVVPGRGLETAAITRVTGVEVSRQVRAEKMAYRTSAVEHPLLRGIPGGTTFELQPFGYAISRKLHPLELGPVFDVTDDQATTLGVYADDRAALAVKTVGRTQTIYCAVPYMDRRMLRNAAAFAGVHLYGEAGPVYRARGRFVMVHKGFDSPDEVPVSLAAPADTVTDMFTGERLACQDGGIVLKGRGCRTFLLSIGQP